MTSTSKIDISKASKKLSELYLKFTVDNMEIEVTWFRVMIQDGEWHINRHTHSSYEFHFIRKGRCRVELDDGSFYAEEGEFYLTAPGVFHEQSGDGELVEFCINCDLRLVEDRLSESGYIMGILEKADCKTYTDSCGITGLFEQALNEAYNQEIGYYNNIRSLVSMIVFSTARVIASGMPAFYETPEKVNHDGLRFKHIEKFIDDNIYNPLTVHDIAKFMFLSEKQICRIITDKKGVTTKKFIMAKKLEKAKDLLKHTELPIKEVSHLLGFSSEYYFSQFFKRREGYPPGTYRINVRNV